MTITWGVVTQSAEPKAHLQTVFYIKKENFKKAWNFAILKTKLRTDAPCPGHEIEKEWWLFWKQLRIRLLKHFSRQDYNRFIRSDLPL